MTTAPVPLSYLTPSASLTATPFDTLVEMPSKLERFATLIDANPPQAFQQDIKDFQAFAKLRWPENLRDVTSAHVMTRRQQLTRQDRAHDTIRGELAELSSVYAYLLEPHAVLTSLAFGVIRPRSMIPKGVTLKGKGDCAILAMLLDHAIRREELCTLKAGDF